MSLPMTLEEEWAPVHQRWVCSAQFYIIIYCKLLKYPISIKRHLWGFMTLIKQVMHKKKRCRKGWPRPLRRGMTSGVECGWHTGQSPPGHGHWTSHLWRREWASRCPPTHPSPALKDTVSVPSAHVSSWLRKLSAIIDDWPLTPVRAGRW